MNQNIIYYPCFALFFLSACVLLRMGYLRVQAVKGGMDAKFYKTYDNGSEPRLAAQASRNFINLLEAPTLFYMVCLFALSAKMVDHLFLWLAWAYVIIRYVHSAVHLTKNILPLRMILYFMSWTVLFIMATKLLLTIA